MFQLFGCSAMNLVLLSVGINLMVVLLGADHSSLGLRVLGISSALV